MATTWRRMRWEKPFRKLRGTWEGNKLNGSYGNGM
jgi:hypothetical protein